MEKMCNGQIVRVNNLKCAMWKYHIVMWTINEKKWVNNKTECYEFRKY